MPWGAAAQSDPGTVGRSGCQDHRVIIIVVTGLTFAFEVLSGGFRRLIQIVFGLSIAFAASRASSLSFFLRRRRGGLMDEPVTGFVMPVHRAPLS